MKYSMASTKNKCRAKDSTIVLYMFILTIISLLFVRDSSKQDLAMHSVYAIILMAMGIIVFNTMRFNIERLSKFLGITCGLTGLLEIIYVVIGLNINHNTITLTKLSMILSIMSDILPILALYFGLKFKDRKNNLTKDAIKIVLILSFIIIALCIVLNDINIENPNIFRNYNKLYFLELTNSILIISLSFGVIRNLKYDKYSGCNEQIYFLNKMAILIGLSRVSNIFHFAINDIYLEGVIAHFITNIAVYYLYQYIVYSNIKKPYLKLNETSMLLKEKAEKLKYNNKKLLNETDTIQNLKKELTHKEMRLQSTLNHSPNLIVVFNINKEITFVNKTFKENFMKEEKEERIDDCLKSKIVNYDDIIYNIDNIVEELCNKEDYIYTIDKKVYLVRYTPLIIKQKLEGVLCILIDKTKIKIIQKN